MQSQIYSYYVLDSYLKGTDIKDREKIESEVYNITSQILKQEYFSEIIDMGFDSVAYETETKRLNHPTALLSTDPLLLNQLASLRFSKGNDHNSSWFSLLFTQMAKDVIMSLKKEYNIKDEVKEE